VLCCDPYRKKRRNALDWVQNKAVKFEDNRNDSKWETLAQRRKLAFSCVLIKAYTEERLRRLYMIAIGMLSGGVNQYRKLGAESKRQISENVPL
jgi:hypothetical protein